MYNALETMKTFVMCCIRVIVILYSFPLIRSLFSDNVLRFLFFYFVDVRQTVKEIIHYAVYLALIRIILNYHILNV